MKYLVIKQALSNEMADFIYNYFSMKRKVVKKLLDDHHLTFPKMGHSFFKDYGPWGQWGDIQISNTYQHYADLVMETLLEKIKPRVEKETGLTLVPTYSYARLYKKGDVLKRHTDRSSCKISTTLFLGGEPWDFYLDPSGKEEIKISLAKGDMLFYRGADLAHWRKSFEGDNCCQVFLHYNETGEVPHNKFDRRPFLGLPSWYKE